MPFKVIDRQSFRSPRFYERILTWFRSRQRGKHNSSSDSAFPTEKHGNLKHCANLSKRGSTRTKLTSTASVTVPGVPGVSGRSKLSSTTSNISHSSLLLPGRVPLSQRYDTVESGYHSNSQASSPASSKSRLCVALAPILQTPRQKKSSRFRFLKKKFQFRHTSLSEDIPELDTNLIIATGKTILTHTSLTTGMFHVVIYHQVLIKHGLHGPLKFQIEKL